MQPQDQPHNQPVSASPSEPLAGQPQPQPAAAQNNQPQTQYVYVTRPMEPEQPPVSEEQRQKHAASKAKYPSLNLSEGEYVISAIKRHPIGLLQIWGVVAIIGITLFGMAIFMATGANDVAGASSSANLFVALALLLTALAVLGGIIGTWIYNANEFFLTNESVIQLIQNGLFAKREQTVSLSNIEDASFTQNGILPHVLDYGMIRLSTEGDETTYRFNFASSPQKQVAVLNNAVEAFKNGRPVHD